MKKILLTFVVVFLMIHNNSLKAQENVVKINLFSPVVRTISVFYEKTLTENTSGQLGFFYTGYKVDKTNFSGYGITPEWRYYVSETALRGVYLAPFLRFQSFLLKGPYTDEEPIYDANGNHVGNQLIERESKGTLTTVGGGLLVGRQWLFKDKISLDIFIGPSYNSGSVKIKEGKGETLEADTFEGFSVRGGLTVGIAF